MSDDSQLLVRFVYAFVLFLCAHRSEGMGKETIITIFILHDNVLFFLRKREGKR